MNSTAEKTPPAPVGSAFRAEVSLGSEEGLERNGSVFLLAVAWPLLPPLSITAVLRNEEGRTGLSTSAADGIG